MSRFLSGVVVGALLLGFVMHYHVVRGSDGVFLVPKLENGLDAVYSDIRKFSLDDWRANRPLAAAIQQSNRTHLHDETPAKQPLDLLKPIFEGLLAER